MKAWVFRKDKSDNGIHIFQESVDMPVPGPNQVLLKVEKVSVCGTDESLFRGDLKRVTDGTIPGHEFYGKIIELGPDVKNLSTGQRVAGESHYQIGDIPDQGIIGLWGPEIRKGEGLPPIHGAYAEYMVIPAECANPVPDGLISEGFWPSLFEAIGNDYFLIQRVKQDGPVRNLGVFGCGPHGLFAQIFARFSGIPKIAAFEVDAFRRDFAAKLDAADVVYDPSNKLEEQVRDFTNGDLFDVTIDMVGKQGQGLEACYKTTKDGGTIYLFGLFNDRYSIEGMQGNDIIFHMKTLQHTHQNKKFNLVGITGREGVWQELIQTVSREKHLQEHLMKPVTVMGTLDKLGEDTRHPASGILKRAYHMFG